MLKIYVHIAIICCWILLCNADFYKSDGYTAYTWPGGYPQSCTCAENGVRRDSCNLFKCNCLCDVTAGKCDFNCCCDPDCSADQVDRFSLLGVCGIETYSPSSVQLCYSSLQLSKVNPRTPMGSGLTARSAVGDALCVIKQNNVIETEFYQDTDLQSPSVFSESGGEKDFDYAESNFLQVAVDPHYDQNDTIAVFSNTSLYGLVTSGSGYFQISRSDFSGKCNENNYVRFERDAAPDSCLKELSFPSSAGFSTQCQTHLSVRRYVQNLFVARAASEVASAGYAAMSSVVPVTLSSVVYRDFLSGASSDVTNAYIANQCGTTAHTLYSHYRQSKASCLFSSTSSTLPAAVRNSSAVCQSMVTAVHYTVTHSISSYGSIDNVTAAVTISDVPLYIGSPKVALFEGSPDGFGPGEFPGYSAVSPSVTVAQAFSVSFGSADTSQTSNLNGNVVKRPRSGNPGYLQGLPVLFGQQRAAAPTTVDEFVGGFAVPSPTSSFDPSNPGVFGKAFCPSSSSRGPGVGVAFGYDMSSGCVLTLNRAAFESFCCAGSGTCSAATSPPISAYSDAASGLPHFFNITPGYVGIFGNADPLDINQWFQLSTSVPVPTRKFDPRTGICSNMFTGVHYQFLVAKSGEHVNPQNKIVAALAEVTLGDFITRIPFGDNVTVESFQLTVTVSFVQTSSQALLGYSPPAPPVLFRVPYDVFYPFYQSSPAPRTSPYPALSLLLPLFTAILVACQTYR